MANKTNKNNYSELFEMCVCVWMVSPLFYVYESPYKLAAPIQNQSLVSTTYRHMSKLNNTDTEYNTECVNKWKKKVNQ